MGIQNHRLRLFFAPLFLGELRPPITMVSLADIPHYFVPGTPDDYFPQIQQDTTSSSLDIFVVALVLSRQTDLFEEGAVFSLRPPMEQAPS